MLVITDGGPGLLAALSCISVPASASDASSAEERPGQGLDGRPTEFKADWWKILRDIDAPPGQGVIDEAGRRAETFASRWKSRYHSTHLRFLTKHHKRIRYSNFIERTFAETPRRVKVIGRLPESSCLSLVWAVLDRASHTAGVASPTPRQA